MNIGCPYCKAVLNIKKVRPGRFEPQCPGCHNTFVVIIPEDPDGTITVQKPPPAKSGTAGDTVRTPSESKSKGSTSAQVSDTVRIPAAPKELTLEEKAALLLEGKDLDDTTVTDAPPQSTPEPDPDATEEITPEAQKPATKPAPKPAPKKKPPRAGSSNA